MMHTKFLKTILTTALLAAPLVHAVPVNNPLHPSYFWDKAAAPAFVASNVDASPSAPTNPLQPNYYAMKSGVDVAFVSTAATKWPAVTNPLHPQFRRN